MRNAILLRAAGLLAAAAIAAPCAAADQSSTRLSNKSGEKPAPAVEQRIELKNGNAATRSPRPVPLPAGVLGFGEPPLTEAMVAEMADVLGRATGSPFTATEQFRLRQRAVERWALGVGYQDSVREAHAALHKTAEKVESFPAQAQAAAWQQAAQTLQSQAASRPEGFLAEALKRQKSVVIAELVSGNPKLTKNAAQAYFEMRDYFEDAGRNSRTEPTVTEVFTGGAEVAALFRASSEGDRRFIGMADRAWAVARAHLDALTEADRGALRARAEALLARPGATDLTGNLTPSSVRALLEESRLTAPVPGFYWTAELPAP